MQDQPAQAPATPAAPTPPTPSGAQGTAATTAPVAAPVGGPYTAAEMYQAVRQQRQILQQQLNSVESDRSQLARELRDPMVTGADRVGIEGRVTQLDSRIRDLQEALAASQAQEAQAAGQPGATARTEAQLAEDRNEMMLAFGFFSLFVIALPLSIAYARRLWKKRSVTITLPPELTQRLQAIEEGVESTAVEVERIGEGQRFVTQLLASRKEEAAQRIPAGGAE